MRYRIIFVIIGPFLLWGAYFTALYSLQGIGCSANWDTIFLVGLPVLRIVLVAVFLLFIALSAWIYMVARKTEHGRTGIVRIGHYCALAGMLSTIIIFPGVFWLKLC